MTNASADFVFVCWKCGKTVYFGADSALCGACGASLSGGI